MRGHVAVSDFGETQDIMNRVGWFSQGTFDRYSRLSKIAEKSSVRNLLK